MTRQYARDLLGVEDRMFRYLMAAENVPTPCSVNGVLTAQAEAAVWRLVEKRRQSAVIAEPLPTPPPPEPTPAAPTVEFQAYVELHNRIIRLEAEADARQERLAEPLYRVADAVADIDARLAALERPARVRGTEGLWARFCEWLQQNGGVQTPAKVQAAPARQEFAPTEVYYASAEGGTRGR